MQIQSFSNYKYNKNTYLQSHPSFKQIRPEHLYINANGFAKDAKWAEHVIGIINIAKLKIKKNAAFKEIVDYIAKSYGAYAHEGDKFGVLRDSVWRTDVLPVGKYAKYQKQLIKLIAKDGEELPVENSLFYKNFKIKKHVMRFKGIPLNQSFSVIGREKSEVVVTLNSPEPKYTRRVFQEVSKIYTGILENKKELTPKNIKVIAKEVAKIHWIMSQARPYCRGSAGIADTLAKSLFEAKGIQVSPYKQNVNPNLEAFALNFNDYVNAYSSFYTKELVPLGTQPKFGTRFFDFLKKLGIGGEN